jgi:hypothetical protein
MAGGRENLIPYKPGQCGNPNGRPKKLPDLDKILDEVLGAENKGKTEAQQILAALLKKAKKGDVRAAEILLDRAFGKPKQQIDHTSKGEPITPIIKVGYGSKDAEL